MIAVLVVRYQKPGHAADGLEGTRVCTDPVGKRLRPRRLRIGEVRCPQDGDKYLRLSDLAGQPVNHHRRGIAGVIDEQLVATQMGLPHRDGDLAFPGSVKLAEAAVAIPFRVSLDVLVPQDRQGDVLALHLPVQDCPVRLGAAPMLLLLADVPATPNGTIPEWWARINRNAGRQLIGMGGRHHPGTGGRLAPESAIRAASGRLFYLPKYSPDLNPIEEFFSKFKHWLKRHSAPSKLSTMRSVRSSTPSHRPNAKITSPTRDMTKPNLIPL
jgi:transposase